MTIPYRAPLGVAAGCAWLWVAVVAVSAHAQDEEPTDVDTVEEPESSALAEDPFGEPELTAPPAPEEEGEGVLEEDSPPGDVVTPPEPLAPAPSAAADEDAALATFEPLPVAAFPVYKTRGIPSGSLTTDSHGLQWPYLPARAETEPQLRIGFSGSAWVDNAYQTIDAGAEGDLDIKQWIQQGRLVLRFSPTFDWKHGWFVQAQGEPVLNNDQTQAQPLVVDADDLYVKVGKWKLGDLQLGRFQGWEVYHLGLGLDLNTFERRGASSGLSTPVELYGVTTAWDRPSGVGNVALHVYPVEFARVELLAQLGNSSGYNTLSTRPVGILDFGFLKLKGGYEYQKLTSRQTGIPEEVETKGGGGQLQVVIDRYVELGGGYAATRSTQIDRNGDVSPGGCTDTSTFGGFLNVGILEELAVGGGLHFTKRTNLQLNARTNLGEERTHLQAFGAVQYRLWNRLYLKAVVAYSKAEFDLNGAPARYENSSLSERLRVLYTF